MRKSLLWSTLKLAVFCLAILGVSGLQSEAFGQTLTSDYCQCDNAGTYPDSLRFQDELTITSGPGETWFVLFNEGLYDPATFPALSLIPFGTTIPETAPGIYTISGLRNYGQAFLFAASDGPNTLTNSTILSLGNCVYPPTEITGDPYVCPDEASPQLYSVDIDPADLATINWSISPSSAGLVVNGQGTPDALVDWANFPINATLTASGTTALGCDFSVDMVGGVEATVAMACNNLVNLSMDENCELNFVPDMILENMEYTNDSYTVTFYDDVTGDEIPFGSLGDDYIGTLIQVSVTQECGGNSCWGYINLEDKSAPGITCGDDVTIDCDQLDDNDAIGYPFDINQATLQADGAYLVSGYDNCGDGIFENYDTPVSLNLCDDPDYSAIIDRVWLVTDNAGNSSSCAIRINVRKATTAAIVWPGPWDDVLGSPAQPSLDPCDNWTRIPDGNPYAGHPDPSHTGYPEGIFCLNVITTFTDLEIPICIGNLETYKIFRTWTVQDICSNAAPITHEQIITVMDTKPPLISCPPEFQVPTAPHSCIGDIIDLPAPTIIDECSDYDYFVTYKLRDASGDPYTNATDEGVTRDPNTDLYSISFPQNVGMQDTVWIIYTVIDACDNQTQCFTEASFDDQTQPSPVCDLHSFIGLNDNGEAFAGPLTFDDGSNDNCEVAELLVRRTEASNCEDTEFKDLIRFCCDDVGKIIMVELQVTDANGNANTCTVEVEVQDNSMPSISCPADNTIHCTSDISNLNIYGVASADFGVCNAGTIEEQMPLISDLDCGESTIVRTWVVTNSNGNSTSCSQTLQLVNLNPFDGHTIDWPEDHTFDNACGATSFLPANMPAGKQEPIFNYGPCSNVASTYKDIVFQYVDGACRKIVREWTVIDWCAYSGAQGSGVWNHTQIIKIQDTNAPQILTGCSLGSVQGTEIPGCGKSVTLTATGTDNCTADNALIWNYAVDVNFNGSIDDSGNGSSVTLNVPNGTHQVCWTLEDECGNVDDCCGTFTITDDNAPSPSCLLALTTVLNTNGTAEIWASDFNASSVDDCTPTEDLIYSFSTDLSDQFATFTCADIANGISDTIDLTVYVTDNFGNSDFCITQMILQDNGDFCPDAVNPANRIMIQGQVFNENHEMIEDVDVSLLSDQTGFPLNYMVDIDGEYAFSDLLMYHDYSVEAEKLGDAMNGVSTLDLILIQKHILGITSLGSPYKLIAADVNNSSSVSAVDLIELRKLILGIYADFPNNDSWRFVDESHVFADESHPFPFVEFVAENALDHDMMNTNFIGVKIGDVNESALTSNASSATASSRNDNTVVLNAIADQKSVRLQVGDDVTLAGSQFTLHFDATKMTFAGVSQNSMGITDANIALVDPVNGILTFSWNNPDDVQLLSGDALVILEFDSNTNSKLTQGMSISSTITKSEAYVSEDDQLITSNIEFRVDGTSNEQKAFVLYQNVPNPFSEITTVSFEMPSTMEALFTVFDATGRVVYSNKDTFQKGYNEITFDVKAISASGILYYQLESYTHTATKKMIVIK